MSTEEKAPPPAQESAPVPSPQEPLDAAVVESPAPASLPTPEHKRLRTISFTDPNPIDEQVLQQGQHRNEPQHDVYASAAKAAGVDPTVPIGRTITGTSVNVNPPPVEEGKPPRKIMSKWDAAMAKLQLAFGKAIGNEKMVNDAMKKQEIAKQDEIRLTRTISAGAGKDSWLVRVKRRMTDSHVAVSPGYGKVWGGGPGSIAGIPDQDSCYYGKTVTQVPLGMFLYNAAKDYIWGNNTSTSVMINVSWLGKRFALEFDPQEYPMATVGDLRRECGDETSVPLERVRLIYKGNQLKDDGVKLIDLGIRSNATIMMSGAVQSTTQPKHNHHPSKRYQPTAQEEEARRARHLAQQKQHQQEMQLPPGERAFQRIASILEEMKKTVVPMFDEYEELIKARPTATSDLEAYGKRCEELHMQCTELTMQQLLKLDGVSYEVDDGVLTQQDGEEDSDKMEKVLEAQKVAEQVRQERKKAVRYLQGWLEKADVLKGRVHEEKKHKEAPSEEEEEEEEGDVDDGHEPKAALPTANRRKKRKHKSKPQPQQHKQEEERANDS